MAFYDDTLEAEQRRPIVAPMIYTPLELIALVKPDILVKGGDYDMARLAETAVVEAYGGRALALPFVDGYSTSALVQKIRQGQALK